MLVVDGVALGAGLAVAAAGTFLDVSSVFVSFWTSTLSFTPLLFTGPIVHLAKRQPARALASFAMRAGFFSLGVFGGGFASAACGGFRDDSCRGAAVGAVLGASMLAPILLDALLLSKGDRPRGDPPAARRAGAPALWPAVSAGEGRLVVGLSGIL